ncbi:MAG: Ppx/GppA family phosphatase [Balneolaceae bacterium]
MDIVSSAKEGKLMRRAAIDIGTNTVLLLIADVSDQNNLKIVADIQRAPRLGEGVDKSKSLSDESCNRVINVLKEYQQIIMNHHADWKKTVVTATSAVRDAFNKNRFINKVKKETGLDIRVLTGNEEAEFSFKGAVHLIKNRDLNQKVCMIDIGGGSTEIVTGKTTGEFKDSVSLDMGSVRYTERFLQIRPVCYKQIEIAVSEIKKCLSEIHFSLEGYGIISIAGTATSLAGIKAGLTKYDAKAINGMILKRIEIKQFIDEFSISKPDKMEKKYAPFLNGRSDIILAGCLILYSFLELAKAEQFTVSTGGLRHGIILENL